MKQILEEQLSACLDGELPSGELDLILARLDGEPARRATLARYAMVGECLRSGAANPAALGVAERVRLALIAEAPGRPTKSLTRGAGIARRSWIAGAVAAAVAVVAVLVAGPGLWGPSAGPGLVRSGAAPIANGRATGAQSSPRAQMLASRLTGYLMAHGEYTNQLSRSTFDSHLVSGRAERVSWAAPADPDDVR